MVALSYSKVTLGCLGVVVSISSTLANCMWIHCCLFMAWVEEPEGAIIDSFKPKTRPRSLRVGVTFDAVSKVDMQYSIGVVNGGMGKVIEEELSGVNDDVKDGGRMGKLKAGDPSLPDVMAMDEGDGASYEEGVRGGMMEGSGMGTLEGGGMMDTRVVGETNAWEGVIGENTLPDEGILKEKRGPMSGGVAVLGPTEDKIGIHEIAIEVVGEIGKIHVLVVDVGGSSSISYGSSSPTFVSSSPVGEEVP
eukprot:Gb_09775 [translate_table: standard]